MNNHLKRKSMKKLFLTLLPALFGITLLFTSCDKKEGMMKMTPKAMEFSLNELVVWDEATGTLTTDLIAGKHYKAGEVIVTSDGTNLTVKYVTAPGYMISETHLSVTESLEEVPGYDPDKGGNPKIGNFNYTDEWDPWQTVVEYKDIPITATPMYIMAHAVVNGVSCDPAAIVLPESGNLSIVQPNPNKKSFFEISLSNAGILNGIFDGWCADWDRRIWPDIIYDVYPVSTYDPDIASMGLVEQPANLDLVNWILNQDFIGKSTPFGAITYGDIQQAIWALIDEGTYGSSGLGSWSIDRALWIKAEAMANGEGFVPKGGQVFGILMVPYGDTRDKIVAQITLIPYPVVCGSETAWGAGLDFGGASWAMYFTYPKQ